MSIRLPLTLLALACAALALTSCFESGTVACSGGVVCPAGSACTVDGLGCVSDSGCGDGTTNPAVGEQCDDGNQIDTDNCTAECLTNVCGDGHRDQQGAGDAETEECDVLSGIDSAECDGVAAAAKGEDCTAAECGDGYVNLAAGEVCDDGNTVSGDGCKDDCTSDESCGNGIKDTHLPGVVDCDTSDVLHTNCPEVCDDGPGPAAGLAGDGCSPNCLSLEVCGNGITDPDGKGPGAEDDESCDDGDPLDTTCDDDCSGGNGCGNGIVENAPVREDCDNGTSMSGIPDTSRCDADCTFPRCGDNYHNPEANELCDPGFAGTIGGSSPGCNYDCTLPACGDGIVNLAYMPDGAHAEQCDDGNTEAGDGCSPMCRIESCGNGVPESANHEQCDDGNDDNLDACLNNCQLPRCGDGVESRPPLEICDRNGPSQDCNADCTLPACGDGKVNSMFTPPNALSPEACDDGNVEPGDGCSELCRIESCGNGRTEELNGEECDDGNDVDTDNCRNNCQESTCGDGVIDDAEPRTEVCDDVVNTPTCDSDCTAPTCGDGIVNATTQPLGEQCEDGNTTSGDGCSSTCRLEPFPVTVVKTGTGAGTVTSDPTGVSCGSDCTELYLVGTVVTLTAVPAANATFTGWSGAGCGASATCVLVMDGAKTVTASFAATTLTVTRDGAGTGTVTGAGISCGADCTETVNTGTSITLTATASGNSSFTGWTGGGCTGTGACTVTMDQAKTINATFALRAFALTVVPQGSGTGVVSSGPPGIECGTTCTADFIAETRVTLTAAASANSTFTGWGGTGINCPGTGQCSVTMSQARTVTATFALKTFTLSVTKSGASGNITGPGITCNNGGVDCSETVPAGTVITLTAAPGSENYFVGWSGGNCTGTGTCAVTVDSNVTVNAAFADNYLTVVRTGNGSGRVTSSPGGINCGAGGDCVEDYDVGTELTLTATPNSGSHFTGWTGGGCGTSNPCVLTLIEATTVRANFVDAYVLTVTKAGSGAGDVTSAPTGISCVNGAGACAAAFDDQTSVVLTAEAAPDAVFTGWSGACSGTGTCTVVMSQARAVTATFAVRPLFTLTVTRDGNGVALGAVTSAPGAIDCRDACTQDSDEFLEGTVVTLTASVADDATFTGWSGACSGTGPCTVVMSQARAVTATFALRPRFTLTVTRDGDGAALGVVTSAPGTIDCRDACTDDSDDFVDGTPVTLTASATGGATFMGWSGDCSGTAVTCVVTMTAARSATATFAAP